MNQVIRIPDRNLLDNQPGYESKINLSCEKKKNPKSSTSQRQETSKALDENARPRRRPRTDTDLKVTNVGDVTWKKTKGMNLKGKPRKQYKEPQKRTRDNISIHEINNLKSSSATYTTTITRKKKRRKTRSQVPANDNESAAELPITDILDKTKEMQSLSEDSTPLRQLTTDTLYIQGRDADFSAIKISGGKDTFDSPFVDTARNNFSKPIDVSVMAQKFWKRAFLIHQGLLGGLGLMHFILIRTFYECNFEFVGTYGKVSEIYNNAFSFLTAMCLVSSLDRYDIAHLDGKHLREIYLIVSPSGSGITMTIYLTMLCLHQTTYPADDKFSLTQYNATMWTDSNARQIFLEELGLWQRITVTKDILAFVAWIFICIGTRADLLLIHLEAMQKYIKAPHTT